MNDCINCLQEQRANNFLQQEKQVIGRRVALLNTEKYLYKLALSQETKQLLSGDQVTTFFMLNSTKKYVLIDIPDCFHG